MTVQPASQNFFGVISGHGKSQIKMWSFTSPLNKVHQASMGPK